MIRYYRKIIKIRAQDSPNVRHALRQKEQGEKPDGRILVPGVKTYDEYMKDRQLWDEVQQCVCLDAEFHEGAQTLMFPPAWLSRANDLADKLKGKQRKAEAIGIDPAEGGDNTAMAAIDKLGLIELVSEKTKDTSVIPGKALAFARKHRADPSRIFFDRGGGGYQIACMMCDRGHKVQTVGFQESVALEKRRGRQYLKDRIENEEQRYVYLNRRAQMYGMLRILLDPAVGSGFGIPIEYNELQRQLGLIPMSHDEEGRIFILPKQNRSGVKTEKPTLTQLLGCSPDEADALVLAVYGMQYKPPRKRRVGMGF